MISVRKTGTGLVVNISLKSPRGYGYGVRYGVRPDNLYNLF